MKPVFESVSTPGDSSFLVRKFTERYFSAPYHYHPEYELTLILEGRGTRYIGRHMEDFLPGDLVFLGPNVPHCWRTADDPAADSVSVVVHFQEDLRDRDLFGMPEMGPLRQLLERSHDGLRFRGDSVLVREQMMGLQAEENACRKLLLLLDLLLNLSTADADTILPEQSSYAGLSVADRERIGQVMGYIIDNFRDTISLAAAAEKVNMTLPAFCKYFKKATRRTFIEAVNDYRIDHAMRQLVGTDRSISQICFDSGFNDLSNFHKKFKERRKMSPLHYRNAFAG